MKAILILWLCLLVPKSEYFDPSLGGSSSDPVVTYQVQLGEYFDVATLVWVNVDLVVNTVSNGSGSIEIENMPFTERPLPSDPTLINFQWALIKSDTTITGGNLTDKSIELDHTNNKITLPIDVNTLENNCVVTMSIVYPQSL